MLSNLAFEMKWKSKWKDGFKASNSIALKIASNNKRPINKKPLIKKMLELQSIEKANASSTQNLIIQWEPGNCGLGRQHWSNAKVYNLMLLHSK